MARVVDPIGQTFEVSDARAERLLRRRGYRLAETPKPQPPKAKPSPKAKPEDDRPSEDPE